MCAPICGVTGRRERRRHIPASTLVPLLEQANRLQLGGGLSVRMKTNVSLYANADYQLSVGDTDGGQAQRRPRSRWDTIHLVRLMA